MSVIIKIPSVQREVRIGKAFNALFRIIFQTEQVPEDEAIEWRLDTETFFHPFFIGGLSLYKRNSNKLIRVRSKSPYIAEYLKLIHFEDILTLESSLEADRLTTQYINKSYIPICRFPIRNDVVDSVAATLQNLMEKQKDLPLQVKSALSYMLGELVTNIQDHSKSDYGYIYSQYLCREKCLNICIADFGITVYGSFIRSGKFPKEKLEDEGSVLDMALKFASTKNRPDAENRGFGLPTTKRMLAHGMGGAFFILSGNAFHRHDAKGVQTVRLPEQITWDGTIILLQIPVTVSKEFNYLNYIE